jgi:hypothetical protein
MNVCTWKAMVNVLIANHTSALATNVWLFKDAARTHWTLIPDMLNDCLHYWSLIWIKLYWDTCKQHKLNTTKKLSYGAAIYWRRSKWRQNQIHIYVCTTRVKISKKVIIQLGLFEHVPKLNHIQATLTNMRIVMKLGDEYIPEMLISIQFENCYQPLRCPLLT